MCFPLFLIEPVFKLLWRHCDSQHATTPVVMDGTTPVTVSLWISQCHCAGPSAKREGVH